MVKTKKEIREIMNRHLCWGSLSYCCKGRCQSKTNCLKELGLTSEDFKKFKQDSDDKLFMILKGGSEKNGEKRQNTQ